MAKQFKKIHPGGSSGSAVSNPNPTYPEGGSIGKKVTKQGLKEK
jgi:hypothetical protein